MYDELVKRLRDSEHEIDCSLCDRDCCYPDGNVHGKCIIIEAADAIEAQDRHILTLQHEMMAEAESHIAEVNRLNKQIDELANNSPKVGNGFGEWIPVTERLPKTRESILGKKSSKVIVAFRFDDGTQGTDTAHTLNGEWVFEDHITVVARTITHWMPLPDPLKEEG